MATSAARALQPTTFNGHTIHDATYEAKFASAHGGFAVGSTYRNNSVEAARPEKFPLLVRNQPESRQIVLTVKILTDTLANNVQLLKWFDPKAQDLRANNGAGWLVATDSASVSRRIFCVPQATELILVNTGQSLWRITLLASTGTWEANTATSSSANIVASGQTSALTNAGDTNCYLTFVITPNTVMADTNSWIKRRRLIMANNSELPWTDPIGDGWPVDVGENALDTDALNTAGKVLSSLFDLRVLQEGEEKHRWPDPATDDATTKLWVNAQMQARKRATLAVNINSAVTTLNASNADGFFGWPQTGFFLIDTECIQYTARTATSMTIVRGARNTTAAAHLSGALLKWVEHPFADLIYHYDNATDPAPPDDRKPRIDLASSTNALFVWNAGFLNAGDRRSAAWQPMRTDDGFTSDFITLQEIGGLVRFRDTLPSVLKPNFNNIYLDDPAGISTDAAGISIDEIIQANLRLNIYAVDLGGNEVLVASWDPDQNAVITTNTETLTSTAFHIRLNARNGVLTGSFTPVIVAVGATSADILTLDSLSFINDEEDARVIGLAVRASNGTVHIRMAAGGAQPHLAMLESGQRYHVAYYNNGGTTVFHILPDDGGLATGFNSQTLDGANGVSISSLTLALDALNHARHYWTFGGALTLRGQTPSIRVLTDGLTNAQVDAPVKTEELIDLDNIALKRDTTRTPSIVLAAEEVLYLHNLRLKNDATGDYLDVFFPNKLTNPITIDCGAKRITDTETGLDIPFALSPSNASEWLYLQPGAQNISYTEVGVVSTTLAWSFRSAYR